jgi:hypothetical protein
MLDALLGALMELGPLATWFALFFAAIIAVFAVYVGIALRAVLRAPDREQREIRYRVFRDLLDLFRLKRHS